MTTLLCPPSQLIKILVLLALTGLLKITCAWGQVEQGNITGTVSDQSGGVVPGVIVRAINTQTQVTAETTTNESGVFRLPFLSAGEYNVTAERDGFDITRIQNIRITVGLTATINMTLRAGTTRQELVVEASAVQLEEQTAALGNVVGGKQMIELPLLGRNPYDLVLLAPGVLPKGGSGAGPVVNGGRSNTSEILLDGAETRNSTTNDIAYTPPLETVQEFKVLTNSFASEYGRSGGGVLTVATRSGTNDFHGALYEFFRNDKLNANTWANNRVGLPRNNFRRNEYGFAVGGPVLIPKLYNGKNNTFFFFNWEQTPQRAPDNILVTVPTIEQRVGDFSQTRTAAGAPITIYDPNTTVADPARPGQYIRNPFPDNRIPESRIDPIARNVMNYYPLPNRNTVVQNYVLNNTRQNDTTKWFGRLDQVIGSKNRLFFTGAYQKNTQFTPGVNMAFPGEGVNGEQGLIGSDTYTAVLSDTVTFSPSLVGQFRANATRRVINTAPRSVGFDFAQLGFPQSLEDRAKSLMFPRFNVTDIAALGPDRASYFTDAEDNREAQAHLTWLAGGHSLKFGSTFTFQTFNIFRPERPSGVYEFSRNFTQGPNPAAATATAGYGFATFLLGPPTGGQFTDDPALATSQKYYAAYVQDDWRIARNFTLNLGVRWEYQTPWNERYDQLGFFDPDFIDPTTGQNGLLRFTGRDGNPRYQSDPDKNNIAPRVGFAWKVFPKTVVRSGYGLFYFPGSGGVGAGASDLGAGFLATTPVFLGQPPAAPNTPPAGASLAEPFQAGFLTAPATGVGTSVNTAFREWVTPFNHQWNFNIQHELTSNLLVEVAYVGSRGQRIWINRSRSAVSTDYLSLGPALDELVDNPYFGQITTGPRSARQLRRAQLLQPFNHYDGVSRFRDPVGDSIYHGFTARVEKQMSHGLMVAASFTASKLIDNVQERFGGRSTFIDPNNLSLSRSIGEFDRPRNLVVNFIYELPVGQGRAWLKEGVASKIIGQWQVSGIGTFSKGLPVIITGPNNTRLPGVNSVTMRLKDPVLAERSPDRWFDTSAFAPAPLYSLGNDSRTQPQLRGPGLRLINFTLSRSQRVHERVNIQFRADFFNLFNTPQLGDPDGNIQSQNFGVITTASNSRVVQLGLRVSF